MIKKLQEVMKMNVAILGVSCYKCEYIYNLISKMVEENNVDAKVIQVGDMTEILKYNAMMTPAVVIDMEVKCVGRVPSKAEIRAWLGC